MIGAGQMKVQSNKNDSPDGHGIGLEFERLAEMLADLDLDQTARDEVDKQVQRLRELLN
ncbi:hypothetical protein SAMN05880558_11350 [Aeromonas sp. RU39B]|nr:hypothetical protein SAMN05880558_11350 [Aeromonas sp. RU39B]